MYWQVPLCTSLLQIGDYRQNMRPKVSDETAQKIDRVVDDRIEVPVDHLTFEQRVEYLAELVDGASEPGPSAAAKKTLQI